MFEIVVVIWYLVVLLPFFLFMEGSKMLSDFLKEKKIYMHWDIWHSFIVVLCILLIVLWIKGYR
ncbi:hypothetical protein A2W67_03800 [Candidatus Nomurabacteria bacterium RIFCSPLOWO2_02_40_28]|nr:MAG: hypothetical protein A2W50_02055 [Candidatus Nomurabacteria bacterium RIFCSPHIGHO2_02_40_30]OGI79695.1 MAG: hypothetical protein A2W43_00955 [Candidatus Nomurabacteria bacterium RIFCSPHIGHO2_12_40_11]OGI83558.1 MAG: hypothetical protein A3E33_02345 [Candidatus Nomurabacteria bacterium RIFCSPHIGHO2_12_FULL_40_77]OGI96391.1 MAG: hypothetical protein A2W67_03800 [Candidatus Nomurabacteria bacterium RIFCSPLOWO2_02_40_28]OGI99504.1 MAG: hypothetical protein A2W78_01340 [Candidatus Nomurabact